MRQNVAIEASVNRSTLNFSVHRVTELATLWWRMSLWA